MSDYIAFTALVDDMYTMYFLNYSLFTNDNVDTFSSLETL